jgi:hypothetical protein
MDDKEIELLIEKKVAEAKLEVTEKRFHYLIWIAGAMLAIFGAILPFWMTNRSSDKVDSALSQMKQDMKYSSQDLRTDTRTSSEQLDKAIQSIRSDLRAEIDGQSRNFGSVSEKVDKEIQRMQTQFKELAGTQLRKPALECLSGGSSLEGKTLNISPAHENIVIDIKNTGDAPAKTIRIRLYTNIISEGRYLTGNNTRWFVLPSSDEPNYKYAFETQSFPLDPKDLLTVDFNLVLSEYHNIKPDNYPALVKLFYEQPEPRKYFFSINISGI